MYFYYYSLLFHVVANATSMLSDLLILVGSAMEHANLGIIAYIKPTLTSLVIQFYTMYICNVSRHTLVFMARNLLVMRADDGFIFFSLFVLNVSPLFDVIIEFAVIHM